MDKPSSKKLITIPDDLLKLLNRAAEEQSLSANEIVRRGIARELRRMGYKPPREVTLRHGGRRRKRSE
jgi:hypothetical protein